MGMSIAPKKTFQPQYVTILGAAQDDRSASSGLQDRHAAQDQSTHDALAKLGFRDHQRAQPLRRDDQCLYCILSDRVHECRTTGQQRQFAHKASRAMHRDRLTIAEMIALADRYLTCQYDHKTGSAFTNGPQRFTSCKDVSVAKTAHTLDFRQIERGIDLIVPLFSNGLRWRHHDLH